MAMKKSENRRRRIIMVITMCISLVLGTTVSFAALFGIGNNGYKWNSPPTVEYKALSSTLETQTSQAIDDVSAVLKKAKSNMKLVKGTKESYTLSDKKIVVYGEDYGETTWVGITSNYCSGSAMTKSRIKLNTKHWEKDGCMEKQKVNSYQSVFAHELCHATGLTGHAPTVYISAKDCLMYPTVSNWIDNKVYKVDSITQTGLTLY